MSHKQPIDHLLQRQLFFSKDSPVFIYTHQVLEAHRLHDHDFYELMFITSGSGVHHTPHIDHPLHRGSLVSILPGTWHGMSECDALNVNICAINSALFDNELSWIKTNEASWPLFSRAALSLNAEGFVPLTMPDAAVENCRKHLFELRRYVNADPRQARAAQIGQLLLLLHEMASALDHHPLTRLAHDQGLHPVVVKVLQLFDDNPDHDWTLTEISRRFDITPTHLIRLFRTDVGKTPMAYLNLQRLHRAAWLLIVNKSSIAGIGAEVGLPDPNHFARRFKSEFGLSPRQYRAKYSKI